MTQIQNSQNILPANTKWAFTTRRVNPGNVCGMNKDLSNAVPGDLVFGQIKQIGQHKKLQLTTGRASESYLGDYVVMVVGNRYAPDQFEGLAELNPEGSDMIAGGGVIGRAIISHERMVEPTQVQPIGLLTDSEGDVINVASYAMTPCKIPEHVVVIGVFGSSMNAGKTTAAVSLAHGLSKAGYKVGGVKATGTGAFGDFNAFRDAGIPVSDFTDAGMPTTYKMPLHRIESGFETLVGTAASHGAEIVVVEIADGVFQDETLAILEGSKIKDRMDAVMFAAPDALGAVGGVNILRKHGIEPFAVSGKVTRSPLGVKEAELATGVPLISRNGLCTPNEITEVAKKFLPILAEEWSTAA